MLKFIVAIGLVILCFCSACALDFCGDTGVCIVPEQPEPGNDPTVQLCDNALWPEFISQSHQAVVVTNVTACGTFNLSGNPCAACTFANLQVCDTDTWNPYPDCSLSIPPAPFPEIGCQLTAHTQPAVICFADCSSNQCQ